MTMTPYVSPMLEVLADLQTASGARAEEVIGLVLFKASPSKVDLSLFFLKDLISVGASLTTAKSKMAR